VAFFYLEEIMMNLEQMLIELKKSNYTRQYINTKLNNSGYETIEPSFFEAYDDFVSCHGRASKDRTVKVINNLGEIEILRPDITFNIIQQMASLWDRDSQIKLCYDSTIFSNGSGSGIVENRQIGAEYLGQLSIDADLEMLKLSREILEKSDDSVLVVGHTKYLKGLLSEIDCTSKQLSEIQDALYKKQPILLESILNGIAISDELKDKLNRLVGIENGCLTTHSTGFLNSDMRIAIRELEYIKKNMPDIKIDLSLISKFDYYDGLIFKGFNKSINQPVLKGGRYDKLSNLFGAVIPAVGFTVVFDDFMKIVRL